MATAPPLPTPWVLDQHHLHTAEECAALIDSRAIEGQFGRQLQHAAITHLLSELKDVAWHLSRTDRPIDLGADLPEGFETFAHFLNECRNAAVHQQSGRHRLDPARGVFVRRMIVGPNTPRALVVGDKVYGNEFADDLAIFFGELRYLLFRHGVAAVRFAVRALRDGAKTPGRRAPTDPR